MNGSRPLAPRLQNETWSFLPKLALSTKDQLRSSLTASKYNFAALSGHNLIRCLLLNRRLYPWFLSFSFETCWKNRSHDSPELCAIYQTFAHSRHQIATWARQGRAGRRKHHILACPRDSTRAVKDLTTSSTSIPKKTRIFSTLKRYIACLRHAGKRWRQLSIQVTERILTQVASRRQEGNFCWLLSLHSMLPLDLRKRSFLEKIIPIALSKQAAS